MVIHACMWYDLDTFDGNLITTWNSSFALEQIKTMWFVKLKQELV